MNNQQETKNLGGFRILDWVGSSETKCEIRGQLRKDIVHSPRFILFERTLIELVWTITPALILILIAFPSFKLLYLMDEVSDPAMSVLAEGHQWYWSYQYSDFLNDDNESIEFDSYMIPEEDLEDGGLRMLEVDNRVILPELTHVRLVITASDVIHSFAVPSLGIKADAYPGRLNQVSVLINREGVFYGQCSEICGVLHSSMPIVIESVSLEKFLSWLDAQASLLLLSRQHVSSNTKKDLNNNQNVNVAMELWGKNLGSTVGGRLTRIQGNMVKLSKSMLGVLVGLILSDGYLNISNGSKNARLGFKQSLEKSKYFWFVFNTLSHYCGSLPYCVTGISTQARCKNFWL